ncbi:MAG: transcriptional regulator [Vicinamibacterales bacterium]|nr:transcriptional regulator [Vicinamibacterales bacterium]
MLPTPARLLRLLSLLQVQREWPGGDLAARLEITGRTVRRDVERLRDLGYVVDASSGPGGGYRLSAGTVTPPLLLDDDEAVAVAMALGAAASSLANTEDVALRVLAKLDQLLPKRLRRRMSALPAVTLTIADPRSAVDLRMLAAIAGACRDRLLARFRYKDGRGAATTRRVEPMRLVHTGDRWYLAAWDLDRDDWRTFRVDRIDRASGFTLGERFAPRDPPEDFATFVARSIRMPSGRCQARVLVPGTAAEVRARVPGWMGQVEPHDDTHAVLTIGDDSYEAIAGQLAYAGVEFTLLDPPEMAEALRVVAARLSRGVGALV